MESTKQATRLRRAAITLEFIVALPIFLVAIFAVFQFSLFFAGSQQVALASRVGAEFASQTKLPNRPQYGVPPVAHSNRVPDDIACAIRQQLSTAGIEPCCIIMEHNVNSFPSPPNSQHFVTPHQVLVTEFSGCNCRRPETPLPPESVRLTVCVRLTEVMPNCLRSFGFDVGDKTVQQTTVYRHEL